MNEKKENGQKKLFIVAIGAILGVILLIYGNGAKNSGESEAVMASQGSVYDEERYEGALVEKIEGVCQKVRGAGKVSVAVTLDGSYRAIYAQNLADGSSSKREYFLVGSGSSEKALLLGYSPPEILGVAIVCEGGGNVFVKSEIIAMVSALLDLPTNKIYVAASNN